MVMEHSGEVMDVLVVRNVISERVSVERNINRGNARVGSGNGNGRRASYRKRGKMRERGHALGREGEGGVPGGVYKGMRSSQAEESILEVRDINVEASVIELERDSSTGTG